MKPLTPHPSLLTKTARRAVFLDRDGTINVEKDYLYKIEDFEFIPGVPEAIKKLKEAGFLVIVVTNQSGVARGFYSLEDVEVLHRHIQDELAKIGTSIDAFYVCPHHPTEGFGEFRRKCNCRKGKPGMLLEAAREHEIDLVASFMVGDKIADIEAGKAAGCAQILVLTGYGHIEIDRMELQKVQIADTLAHAAARIVEKEKVNG
ncbi:D,D-heptose 1,7-bisphosphate phosphatase [Desulfuromonas versatilis]|uniref:D,D-heptose 1,7-bisphosphate phosphatase n=1 Tax=Desulfuromonas versatilis TaxID=2802975 RepID=A0ABN6DZ01_9BACT|nr:D-glycero-beta-D-manno-heptose 1,7-bisphosphate 7-phosphatase [Desulfuromonas versatilis]BCR05181.1 D,D-heptose 1,7-bisphosphate phosphatase [Desulfuromonas versatilis]